MASLISLQSELRRLVEGDVRFDAGTLAVYSTDASNYRQVPIGVVVPRHLDDVINTVALARENDVPLLPRGGGTSLAGQACNTALVIDFSKYMTAIRSIDADKKIAVVEPGVVQSRLNAALAPQGLFFAPDPATKDRCTIGGMIGNNSCGAHSAAHGKTVDNLLALDVLLYDGTRLKLGPNLEPDAAARAKDLYSNLQQLSARYGELVRSRFPKIPRRVSGYNLDELLPEKGFNLARAMVGSEGTLGLVLGATLKVVPRPKELALVVLAFGDIFVAADQVPWILEHRPEALEAFDDKLVEAGREKGSAAVRLLPEGGGFLIVELGGATRDEARGRGEALVAQAHRANACGGARLFIERAERDAVWGLRESGLGAGTPRPGVPRTWPGAEDCAVPPVRLGQYLRRFDKLLKRRGLQVAVYYGHFGEGCVHCRISFDLATPAGVSNFRSTMLEIGDLVGEFGGSISGEHGDGIGRAELLPKIFGNELMPAFAEFKRAFDPGNRMNPGVIVAPPRLDSHLRLGVNYRPRQVATHFDFTEDGGLAGAALRCVGVGKCRKTDAGAMCPSYMVTRDEIHSTRGRARLLFEALSGDLLEGGFSDDALRGALDLCLSCKSCKTECPAAVDMALYKAEFLSHYYRQRSRPLAAHLFGRIFQWAPLAAAMPGFSNAVAQSFAGEILKRVLGMHRSRTLPKFAPRTFRQWLATRGREEAAMAAAAGSQGGVEAGSHKVREVLFFPDTFTNFFEPDVAIAAVRVLERAGFRVTIPPKYVCCGRPLYDQGMLDLAKERLREIMQVLGPYVERGFPVVGVEPGCILTFRDELPKLYPREQRARLLAERSFLLDEFLAREASGFAPAAGMAAAPGPKSLRIPALLHGHCHQKALSGMDAEIALLRKAPGIELQVLDAGCCGMAGAFGYEESHYDVSRALAERVLAPAIRAAGEGAIVISDGFSCRSQIRHFCPGARALHAAQVLNGEHLQGEEANPRFAKNDNER
jgi:FAD/FMN-containing dehydrogenase/Fe-S oxidoreductase